ncbi:hypothetical protein VTK26DRAFT_9360 [Humicola hyalothermophila]
MMKAERIRAGLHLPLEEIFPGCHRPNDEPIQTRQIGLFFLVLKKLVWAQSCCVNGTTAPSNRSTNGSAVSFRRQEAGIFPFFLTFPDFLSRPSFFFPQHQQLATSRLVDRLSLPLTERSPKSKIQDALARSDHPALPLLSHERVPGFATVPISQLPHTLTRSLAQCH